MASQGNIRETVEVSQGQLHKMIEKEKGVIRCGATANYNNRANGYEREGYSGVLYYARTKNMMKAEDNLLKTGSNSGSCIHNQQGQSNMQEKPGYVYVVKGKKK